MNGFLLITAKSTLCLSVLYGLYALLLKREASFRLNRVTLLFIITVSIAIPLIQNPFLGKNAIVAVDKTINRIAFSLGLKNPPVTSEITVLEVEIMDKAEKMKNGANEKISISSKNTGDKEIITNQKISQAESVIQLLLAIYFVGMTISLTRTPISLFCVFRIVIKARRVKFGRQKVLISRYRINSFTFAGWIVLSEVDFQQHAAEIVTHEAIHRRMAHYLDVCLVNVLTILHWFNPLVWELRRELKSIHEYEADCHTLNQGIGAAKYQLLLIKKIAGASRFAIASSFAQSNIKKRLIMMNKKFNPKIQWKVLILIPMTALLTQAFARQENNAEQYSDIRNVNEPTLQTNGDDMKKSKPPFDEHFVVTAVSKPIGDDDTEKLKDDSSFLNTK
ncbi:MAG: hypothetical protein LBD80_01100 [Tannerella sp.]|jgi:hypothetical protein|nr:hypothetical protein [Tannerella sp.]